MPKPLGQAVHTGTGQSVPHPHCKVISMMGAASGMRLLQHPVDITDWKGAVENQLPDSGRASLYALSSTSAACGLNRRCSSEE
eukprot:5553489-Amphidinium_carterae.2